jgi:putative glutamine amidotransferase
MRSERSAPPASADPGAWPAPRRGRAHRQPPAPLIGIPSARLAPHGDYPAGYRQNAAYVRSVVEAGGLPVLLPLIDDETLLRALYERLDGLLLPGGGDVDPVWYGEVQRPECEVYGVDSLRDRVELDLARWALGDERPVLGICRGQQTLNVAAGGTLYQDIAHQVPDALAHDQTGDRQKLTHSIVVASDSRLARVLGSTKVRVNSLHHQAVARLGPGLRDVAHATDGVVEGLEHGGHPFALAVQFHPEELTPDHAPSVRLFAAFVAACRG